MKNVVEVEDSVAALKKIKSQKIYFMISDWNMPQMTGIEPWKAVSADAGVCTTPPSSW
jgi:two-component system chemotaxis response regulator CheY